MRKHIEITIVLIHYEKLEHTSNYDHIKYINYAHQFNYINFLFFFRTGYINLHVITMEEKRCK